VADVRRRRLPRFFDVVTPAGWSLVVLGVVCYILDAVGGWPVFALLWLVCLLLAVTSVAFALLRSRAKVDLHVSPPRTMAGDGAEIQLEARSSRRLPVPSPLIAVRTGPTEHLIRLGTLHRKSVREEHIELTDLRRGVVPVGPVTARRSDPLALLRWDERWSPVVELLVLPRIVPVESLGMGVIRDQEGTPSDEISMNDLAFHALREYVPGDELRHVHWRSSAKASTLQIRQYHDTRRSHLTVVLDASAQSYVDPEDFEIAVSVSASIAARAHQDGVDVSMLCGDHAVTGRGLDGVLDACCRIQPGDSDPGQAARQALRLAPETSWLVVVTGGAASEDLAGLVRSDLPEDVRLLFVRADGAVPTRVSSGHRARLLSIQALDDLPRSLAAAVQVVSA
jgi:uncharacterized protein (DUF58 family)